MSKLLINEYPLLVLPSLAKKIGLNEAIVLQQLHYWLNQPGVGVIVNGEKWIHNTYEEWQKNFPFWSVDTVKRTIHDLEKSGIVISAQSAPNPFDKTKSYRIQYGHPALLDEGNLHPSITETTVSDTNTMASEEKPVLPLPVMSIENQIYIGSQNLSMPDNKLAQMKDSANLIAMGTGSMAIDIFNIAYAFMQSRDIIIPAEDAKGQRKVAKEMVKQGVTHVHVYDAVQYMISKKLTCVDLFSVKKIAIDLANPAPDSKNSATEHDKFEGV